MNTLLISEFDEELGKDLKSQTNDLAKKIEKLELDTLLSGKYDSNNAIITLHPGARWN
jgi:peptide chain release factor 2